MVTLRRHTDLPVISPSVLQVINSCSGVQWLVNHTLGAARTPVGLNDRLINHLQERGRGGLCNAGFSEDVQVRHLLMKVIEKGERKRGLIMTLHKGFYLW